MNLKFSTVIFCLLLGIAFATYDDDYAYAGAGDVEDEADTYENKDIISGEDPDVEIFLYLPEMERRSLMMRTGKSPSEINKGKSKDSPGGLRATGQLKIIVDNLSSTVSTHTEQISKMSLHLEDLESKQNRTRSTLASLQKMKNNLNSTIISHQQSILLEYQGTSLKKNQEQEIEQLKSAYQALVVENKENLETIEKLQAEVHRTNDNVQTLTNMVQAENRMFVKLAAEVDKIRRSSGTLSMPSKRSSTAGNNSTKIAKPVKLMTSPNWRKTYFRISLQHKNNTWYDAKALCAQYNMTLVEFHNITEMKLVVDAYNLNNEDKEEYSPSDGIWPWTGAKRMNDMWRWDGTNSPVHNSLWYNTNGGSYVKNNCAQVSLEESSASLYFRPCDTKSSPAICQLTMTLPIIVLYL